MRRVQMSTPSRYSLLLVTVNGECRPTILTKILGNVVCHTLRADENQDLGILTTDHVKMLQQLIALLMLGADLNVLLNIMISRQVERTDIDLDEVGQEILRGCDVSETV